MRYAIVFAIPVLWSSSFSPLWTQSACPSVTHSEEQRIELTQGSTACRFIVEQRTVSESPDAITEFSIKILPEGYDAGDHDAVLVHLPERTGLGGPVRECRVGLAYPSETLQVVSTSQSVYDQRSGSWIKTRSLSSLEKKFLNITANTVVDLAQKKHPILRPLTVLFELSNRLAVSRFESEAEKYLKKTSYSVVSVPLKSYSRVPSAREISFKAKFLEPTDESKLLAFLIDASVEYVAPLRFPSVRTVKEGTGRLNKAVVFTRQSGKQIPGFAYLRKETFPCGGKANTVKIYRHGKTGLEFVLVPGGTFWMGSPDDEPGRASDEGPRHKVTVKSFLLCRTECTNEAWYSIDDERDSPKRHGDKFPVQRESWNDVSVWCRRAGDGLRLPTEAEWEYACRAGTEGRFCCGNDESNLDDFAWYDSNAEYTHPVGSRKPNAFGLYDMHGNVWEWCQDRYADYTKTPRDGTAYEGDGSGRVFRGGCWGGPSNICRSANRGGLDQRRPHSNLGFRPASSVP